MIPFMCLGDIPSGTYVYAKLIPRHCEVENEIYFRANPRIRLYILHIRRLQARSPFSMMSLTSS